MNIDILVALLYVIPFGIRRKLLAKMEYTKLPDFLGLKGTPGGELEAPVLLETSATAKQ